MENRLIREQDDLTIRWRLGFSFASSLDYLKILVPMRTRPQTAAFGRWAARLLTAILTSTCAGVALGQISEFNEPPTSVQAQPLAKPAPAKRVEAPTEDRETPEPTASTPHAKFPYTVQPGDSLSVIAKTFGLDVEDLARTNHLSVDAVLLSGKTLKIPNPFLQQIRSLTAELERLKKVNATAEAKMDALAINNRLADEKIESLTATKNALRREAAAMPPWREATTTFGIIALLMFGVTMVTLFDWWLLRRRFAMQVAFVNSLADLHRKYKHLLANAELRFQNLYGRRQLASPETAERSKTAAEIEIERLSRELREALDQLQSLSAARLNRPRRKGFWHEVFGDVEPRIDGRSARR